MEQTKDLTSEEKSNIDKLKKAKTEILSMVSKKLILEEGEFFFGKFVRTKEVTFIGDDEKKQTFKAHSFKDMITDDFVYLTGKALDDVDYKEGDIYKITYNGISDTRAGNRFKSFTVESVTISTK